jgi:plasmid stabilization system protein ParE
VRLVLDLEAKAELRQAAVFYEECRDGLGQEFLDAVESAFDQIRQHPTLWRILKGRFRRYLVHHFPYGVIYAVEGRTIYVAAVMHLKRKPGYWESRGKTE